MYKNEYERWLSHNLEDFDLLPELQSIKNNDNEIKERFAAELSFGTAGLRGILGAGTNRMNIYTIRKATQGLANFLLATCKSPSVAISYDSRIKSILFSREAAQVLAASGVKVHLYSTLQPVPLLSFAVRHLKADAGIMITASHNPAKYNGFKVYGSDGCQMTDCAAGAVYAEIQKLDFFKDINTVAFATALDNGKISYISQAVLDAYYNCVLQQSVRPQICKNSGLKLVYSPLNGAGNVPVRHILAKIGIENIVVVPEQENPDGNFPTCPYPNPEIRETLALGLALAEKENADLMLATDPDADRVGIAVRDKKGEYHLLSGNEVGVMLIDYIAKGKKENGSLPQNPVMVKSVVSTPMADEVAKNNGIQLINVLTGFKYIGEQILLLEEKNEQNRFLFAFEESYGYLAGTYVRDKDAVVASMLICEMAAYYKTINITLYEALQNLYKEYGYYLNKVDSFEFSGLEGMAKMATIMDNIRKNHPPEIGGLKVLNVADFAIGKSTNILSGETSPMDYPLSNVLRFELENNTSIIVRPSGTEPKVKVYFAVKSASKESAVAIYIKLEADIKPLLA